MATLSLINGANTLSLIDNDNIAAIFDGWGLQVPQLRTGWMGNQPLYSDVDEDMALNLFGGTTRTPATLLTNINTIQQYFSRIREWWDTKGAIVSASGQQPTTFQIQLSTSSPTLSALLLPREDGGVQMPASYGDDMGTGRVFDAVMRYRRRGQWLASEEPKTTAGYSGSGNVQTVTFDAGALNDYHPLAIDLATLTQAGSASTGTTTIGGGVLLYTYTSNYVQQVTAKDLVSTSSAYSAVADTTKLPFATNVLRFTPPDTSGDIDLNGYTLGYTTGTVGLTSKPPRVSVWATVRNNTAGKSYIIRAVTSARGRITYGPATVVDYTDGNPHVVSLGTLTNELGHDDISMIIRATATGGTLDIDTIAVGGATSRAEGAIAYNSMTSLDLTLPSAFLTLSADHQLLAAREPFFGLRTNISDNLSADYDGNAMLLTTGASVSTLWLATRDIYWRAARNDGTALTMQMTARRRRAYAVPV